MRSDQARAWARADGEPAPSSSSAGISASRSLSRRLLPGMVILAGAGLSAWIAATGPTVEPRAPETPLPYVRALSVEARPTQLRVRTHGSVVPRTESTLVPEVSGSVIWMSPDLVSGGFFERGEALLRIDPVDARVEVERANAQLERARAEVERTSRELARRKGLAQRNVASANELDVAVSAERVALANQREAEAMLAAARKNLERTELRAPFDGRVRDEHVDLGQFVTRGSSLATLYAIDYAEVRIPIPDRELAFLNLPLLYRADSPAADSPAADSPGAEAPGDQGRVAEQQVQSASGLSAPGPSTSATPADAHTASKGDSGEPGGEPGFRASGFVELRADFAGAWHTWDGQLVRTEGELDPKTRMVHVIARVTDPYGMERGRPPLAVGLFVDVEIFGRQLPRAFVVPRTALRDEDHLWVIDAEDRLRLRRVEVLRLEGEDAVITKGLEPDERVCEVALEIAVEGMQVRTERSSSRESHAPDTERPASPRDSTQKGSAS